MCIDCGCASRHHSTGEHHHQRPDGTTYFHTHHNEHGQTASEEKSEHHHHGHNHGEHKSTVIELEVNILAANERIATANRQLLHERGIITINLISSPGSGKTALLERTLSILNGEIPCAVIVGDQRGDADARRLQGKGAPVTQIETGDACHLNAQQVSDVLLQTIRPETKLLFIENVGNLVCPAAFDLGEDFKIAVLSAPEGEDKPVKYPTLFNHAKVVIISKIDLCPYLDWDIQQCREYLREVNPAATLIELSSRSGAGFEHWTDYLRNLLKSTASGN